MHHSRIYSLRNGAMLCHYLSARRAVNCPATNVASYFKFAVFLLLLLDVISVCLQERKRSIALGCPPAAWCGWGLKRGWKNGKCLTNGAVNAAVDKLIWMHPTNWNRKRKGKWHSQTWSERNSFYRENGLGRPEEATEFASVNTVMRIVAERQRNWGSIPSRKSDFYLFWVAPNPLFVG